MSNELIIPDLTLREAALELAERGYAVFPLRPGAKTPLTAHGLHDATDDLDRIDALWTAHPFANIGLRTGAGLAVIDVDPRHDGAVDPAWPKATLSSTTPNGGWHFYYMVPEGEDDLPSSAGRIAPGVDVRGAGGYVVAPPSRLLAGKGSWEWTTLTATALALDRQSPLVSAGELVSGAYDAAWPAMLPSDLAEAARTRPDPGARGDGQDSEHRAFVPRERVGAGERNDYLARAAGSLYRQGYGSIEVEYLLGIENEAVCVPPVDADEVAQIAASIGRYHR